MLKSAFLTLVISFSLEALQILVPWRHFDVADLVADAAGVLIGGLIARQSVKLTKSNEIHR